MSTSPNCWEIQGAATPTKVQIFKDGPRWFAHLYWSDGGCWPYWQSSYHTKRALIENVRCTFDGPIERGHDEEGHRKTSA